MIMPNKEIIKGETFEFGQDNSPQLDKRLITSLDIFGSITAEVPLYSPTIAASADTHCYVIVPLAYGNRSDTVTLDAVEFSCVEALATHATNYLIWTITNLGQAGAGSTAMLAATDANTTKTITGSAIVANGRRSLILSTVAGALNCSVGDRLKITASPQ